MYRMSSKNAFNKSLFNTTEISADLTNVDNLVVNQTLDISTATVTGDVANWSELQNALDAKLSRSGGNLTGNVTCNNGVTIDGVDVSEIDTTYLRLDGTNPMEGDLDTAANVVFNVCHLYATQISSLV